MTTEQKILELPDDWRTGFDEHSVITAADLKALATRTSQLEAVLREAMGALEHYADTEQWDTLPMEDEKAFDWYQGMPRQTNGYDIAQVAIDKAKEILGGD